MVLVAGDKIEIASSQSLSTGPRKTRTRGPLAMTTLTTSRQAQQSNLDVWCRHQVFDPCHQIANPPEVTGCRLLGVIRRSNRR
jgi:hypothetical protein